MSEPYWVSDEGDVVLHLGDCLDVLQTLEAGSIDAIVTDPPYGLEFMGREWDGADGFRRSLNEADAGRDSVFGRTSRTSPEYQPGRFAGAVTDRDFKGFVLSQQRTRNVKCPDCGKWAYDHPGRLCECGGIRRAQVNVFQSWCEAWAAECLRVLKPGGWMLAFGGTRTWHRLTCAIEDTGFEIRDGIPDLTGMDAPGLMWVYGSGFAKSKDAARAVDMEVCSLPARHCMRKLPDVPRPDDHVCPESEEGEPWRGWGTAAKPAWEPVVVARKPLAGTLGRNLLEYGTGALDIDGCRVSTTDDLNGGAHSPNGSERHDGAENWRYKIGGAGEYEQPSGRWPPNVLLGPTAAAELDRQSGVLTSGANPARRGSDKFRDAYGDFAGQEDCAVHRGVDSGGASRFFPVFRYEAKAAASERPRLDDGTAHPTVKPVDLMAWLVRLVTPPDGLVLDPFAGSGTTAEACIVEGFRCLLIEKDPSSAELIKTRLRKPIQPALFGEAS